MAFLPLLLGVGLNAILGAQDQSDADALTTQYTKELNQRVQGEKDRMAAAQRNMYAGISFEAIRRKLLSFRPSTVGGTIKTSQGGASMAAFRIPRGRIGG